MTRYLPPFVRTLAATAIVTVALAGCHARRGDGNGGVPGDSESSRPFDAISDRETLHFLGTEPFWGGETRDGSLTYTTPSIPQGTKISVRRFAGRNGLGISGKLEGKTFDMTVTPANCSDGMSDRTFPFAVTLMIGSEVREGCGWTDSKRFREAKKP